MDGGSAFSSFFFSFISFFKEKDEENFELFLSSLPFLSFFLFGEGKEWEWEGENVCYYTLDYYNLKYNVFFFYFHSPFLLRENRKTKDKGNFFRLL